MKEKGKAIINEIRGDYGRKTAVFSAFSAAMNLLFALFHAFLGIHGHSLWSSSISAYYVLIFIIRVILVVTLQTVPEEKQRKRIHILTHVLLMMMNISLIIPIAVMIKGERGYRYGLIPAITMALYTTYRVSTSIINYRKAGKNDSMTVRQLRTINLLDSILAVLTLQNAMIIATGGMNSDMHTLMIYTSTALWLLMVFISVSSFRTAMRAKK